MLCPRHNASIRTAGMIWRRRHDPQQRGMGPAGRRALELVSTEGRYRMTTQPVDSGTGAAEPGSTSFERFAGTCAVLAGVAGFLYAVAFVVLQNILLSGLFLMLGGLLSTAVLAGVYDRLRETDASFALW